MANFMKKHTFSVRKREATSIARAMAFHKPCVERFLDTLMEQREIYKFPASSIYNADVSQTLEVDNQLIKPAEESKLMANANSDAPKKHLSNTKHIHQRNLRTKGSTEGRTGHFKQQRRETCEAKKGVKKLELCSGRPKSIRSSPNSPVASTLRGSVIRFPACEEEYSDPPTEN
ncbi:hypothetical protein TNCV_4177721 [Trichonephila clavipes]|nr:hypothetical protein TNCV_4177721 [Trichonephila clavipes]